MDTILSQAFTPAGLVGLLAIVVNATVLARKGQGHLPAGIALSLGLWGLHYWMLGAVYVAVMASIGLVWWVLCAYCESKGSKPGAPIFAVAIVINAAGPLLVETSWLAVVAAAGGTSFVIAGRNQGMRRRALLMSGHGFFAANAWIVGSIWGLMSDGTQLAMNLLGSVRERKAAVDVALREAHAH